MKMKVSSVAFAMLLAPAILIAETTNVTFDAALTNETGWVYIGNIKPNKEGDYYINGQGATIISPCYNFAITSIVLHISTSASCNRNLIISSYDNVTSSLSHEFTDIPKGTTSDVTATWNISDHVRSLAITSTIGAQNLYFYSAVISGAPIIDAPTNLLADDIKGTRFRLSWANPENAVSNKIEVSEIVETETSGGSILEYDFNDFTNNSGSATDITDDFTNAIPAFAGSSLIRLPANTNGIIQISKDTAKGYLVHSGFADYSSMSLAMSIRRPTSDHGKTFGIGYLSAEGTTNEFATFSLEVEFRTNTVSLASVPANASIILNTQGANSKRVVYIDYMAFIGDSLSTDLSTNLVKTAFVTNSTMYCARDLSPRTQYIARITAFDADGNESSPSEPLAVTTNGDAIPFSIRIQ